MFASSAVCSLVWAFYRVWRDSLLVAQETITCRDVEIEKLKHRPYDAEHRELAQRKVDALTDSGKDLVRFLLHNGEIETDELKKRCQNPAYFDEALQRTRTEMLIVADPREIKGRSGVHYFWKINPHFQEVLRDLDLTGRREPRYFL